MKDWKWLSGILVVFAGVFGLFLSGVDVYADDESKGSFNIYATKQDCSYIDNIEQQCTSNRVKTAGVTLGSDGKYKVERFDDSLAVKDRMEVTISGNKLTLKPTSCAMFNNCSDVITVDLKDNVTDTVAETNSKLTNQKWYAPSQPVACLYGTGCYSAQTTYYFSAEDVTDPTKVPAVVATNSTTGTNTAQPTCMNSGAANSLGWVVCPVLEWLSDASQSLYDQFVEPALQVDPQLFTGLGANSGTRSGWEIFRNISNVLFIILFMVVIFSQLTGVGIDNFGIKKILPKLIVSAILINLSYWICVALVDLSNIIGNAMQEMFNTMASGLTMPSSVNGIDPAGSFGATALTSVALLGIVATGIWAAIGSAPGIGALLLVLLVAALNIIVTLFFLFILLAAREAAIVVLIVLSPLAFACYMLPNTKNLFDKWWKMGQALLLVYPIAGLLVGGGNFVSKLLLVAGAGSGSFFSAFVAMIVGVVPIYFIPTVLRNSFQGLGNLGAKISGWGQKASSRISGNTDRAIRGTNRYKSYENEMARRSQERSATRNVNRLNRRRGIAQRFNRDLSATDQRALARSTETLEKMRREDTAARTALADQEYGNRTEAELQADWDNAFDSGNTQQLDALTNVMVSRYGTGAAKYIGDKLGEKSMTRADGTVNQAAVASMNTLRDNMQHNSNFGQMMRSKASDAYQMISNGAIVGRDGNNNLQYANLEHFSANNAISTSAGDWATQSASTLQRALDNGALTAEQAKEILESTDPAIQSGLQTDAKKRDVLQAAVYNDQNNPSGVGPNLPVEAAAAQYRADRQAEAEAPTIRSSGAYEHSSGNVVQLHEMSDGTFVDAQNGQTVDITHYKKR